MNISTEIEWVKTIVTGKKIAVSKYPITNRQYAGFVKDGGYQRRDVWSENGWAWKEHSNFLQPSYWFEEGQGLDLPVTGVSFWEAEAFSNWLGARIPLEDEWYDFCVGVNKYKYPWGEEYPTKSHCNLSFFGEFSESKRVPVDMFSKGSTSSGIFDLIGNVSEWCVLEQEKPDKNNSFLAVLKGGCCWHTPTVVDCNFRDVVLSNTRDNQTGIRVIRDIASTAKIKNSYLESSLPQTSNRSKNSIHQSKELKRPTTPFRQEGKPDKIDINRWRLKITGDIDTPLTMSLDEIKNKFLIHRYKGLFVCVCRWADINLVEGVLIKDIIKEVGINYIDSNKYFLIQKSIENNGVRYITSVNLKQAIDNGALLCFAMDGEDLTDELGFPIRYIDFSRYGYKQVKALEELEISKKRVIGWWEKKQQYDIHGKILPGTATLIGKTPVTIEIK